MRILLPVIPILFMDSFCNSSLLVFQLTLKAFFNLFSSFGHMFKSSDYAGKAQKSFNGAILCPVILESAVRHFNGEWFYLMQAGVSGLVAFQSTIISSTITSENLIWSSEQSAQKYYNITPTFHYFSRCNALYGSLMYLPYTAGKNRSTRTGN